MDSAEVGPLRIGIDDATVQFRFVDPDQLKLEVPRSLEQELRACLEQHADEISGKRFVIDLQDRPAVSSRQLGTMLTIRKTCEPFGTVELSGVSDNVSYLLRLTRIAGYFGID